MKILDLHHAQITIPQGAEQEARQFYCGVLGLLEIEKPHTLKGRGGFWVKAGSKEVHVGVEEGIDRHRTKAHLAYFVDNLDAWEERLTQLGISVQHSVPIPGYARFEIRDLFGNRIELIQML
jgi:catechol 2,3-dioxygenase-like lactoylglutathione lyase family enzyme